MPPILLLATMALAHADDPTHHDVDASEPEDVQIIIDLALEGALLSRGLDPANAVRMTAAWTAGIVAPTRARAEGRAEGWAFANTQVQFRNERVIDGHVLDDDDGLRKRGRDDTNCTVLHAQGDKPVELSPMDPRARERGPADTHDDTLDVTWAAGDTTNSALVMLQPGESATVVELLPDPGTRPRRRAKSRRRVEINTTRADLRVVEGQDHALVCLTLNPVTPTVVVARQAERAPATPAAEVATADPPPAGPAPQAEPDPLIAAEPALR